MAPALGEGLVSERFIVPPLFIVEGQDLGIFSSVEDAQDHLEPPDIAGGAYVGYDGRGRRLEIETDGRHTSISLAEFQPSSAEELEARLRHFLTYAGEDRAKNTDCDLPCLIGIAEDHVYRPRSPRRILRSLLRYLDRRQS